MKKDNRLSALGGTVACLREGQEKLIAESKSSTLVNAELIKNQRTYLSGQCKQAHKQCQIRPKASCRSHHGGGR